MKIFSKPVRILSATVLISGILFTSTVDASQALKKLDATYRDIKIIYNNNSATIDPKTEPFISNGVTYVPLKMVSSIFDKNVTWDGKTNTISITDKTMPISPTVIASLNAQITAKDTQITAKDAKIKQLETELANLKTQQSKGLDLDDLEDQLNDDYEDYRYIDDVEISLSGDKNRITVRIDADAKDWKDITSTRRTDFLQSIIDDILSEYKDATVKGTVRDASRSGTTLATFDTDSRDKVRLENEYTNLKDLELTLVRAHNKHNKINNIDIYLRGDEDDVEVTIKVNKTDWTDPNLTIRDKENFIDAIVEDILDEYEDADVEGKIESHTNTEKLNTFTTDSRGYVTIR